MYFFLSWVWSLSSGVTTFSHQISEPFELTPNAQIWPRSQNGDINGTADGIYLVVGDLGTNLSTSGVDFILGIYFLERFYSVYDTTESRVGLAMTRFTYSEFN